MTEACSKCGVVQDPEHPSCVHMAARKGGLRTVKNRGPEFYRAIGRKGGRTNAALRGRIGGQRVRELIERGRARDADSEPVVALTAQPRIREDAS